MRDYYDSSLAEGVAVIQHGWPKLQVPAIESPVFILSAGWRSGSTLLQRMCMEECFMWGEPFGHAGLLDSICDSIRSITDKWPPNDAFHNGWEKPQDLLDTFVANLTPHMPHLINAHLAWFDTLFGTPARATGMKRWGIKEVRWTADHAAYLRWIFPKAKIVFMYRNPYDAYRSFAPWHPSGFEFYIKWPDMKVDTKLFGKHWRELTSGFRTHAKSLDAHVISYEDLCAEKWEDLQNYLGFSLSKRAFNNSPADGGPQPVETISGPDLAILQQEVEPLAKELGYR